MARLHYDEKLHKCPVCEKTFSHKNKLSEHVKMIHKDVVNPYNCKKCGKAYAGLFNYDKHMANVHEEKNRFACGVCPPSTTVSVI